MLVQKQNVLLLPVVSKISWMNGKQCRPWSVFCGTDLILQCLRMPFCPNTMGFIVKVHRWGRGPLCGTNIYLFVILNWPSRKHTLKVYNFDPLKPHFYIVKLGFTRVYIIFFLFLLKNIDCGYSLELPPNLCCEQKYEKISEFLSEIFFFFFGGEIFNIFK